MLPEKVIQILILIATHYTLTAAMIRRLLFGDKDRDGRQTRRLLGEMLRRKLLNKTHMEVTNPLHPLTASVFFPSKLGCAVLAEHTGDLRWLLTNYQQPQWQNLRHFLALSELRLLIQKAIAGQTLVDMPCYFNEFDVVNQEAALTDPAARYRLYTVCTPRGAPKRIVCCPDGFMVLRKPTGASQAYYLEMETGSNPFRTAAEKTPGYAALAAAGLQRRHWSAADSFAVLVFAPNPGWRGGLRKMFAKKERPDLYRFVAMSELTAENFLHGKVFYTVDQGPYSLVNP
jgi:hypothetical protein